MSRKEMEMLERAMTPSGLWTIQDCPGLAGPDGDRPAGGDTEWRSWPEHGPGQVIEMTGRIRLGQRN